MFIIPDLDVFLRVHGPYLSNEYHVIEQNVIEPDRFYTKFVVPNKSPLYELYEKSDFAPIEILIVEGIKDNEDVYFYISYEDHTDFFLEHGELEYLRFFNKMQYGNLTERIEQLKKKIEGLVQPDVELKDTFNRQLTDLSEIRKPYGDWLIKNKFEDDILQIGYKRRKRRKSEFEHSEDYSTVVKNGVEYHLSPNQGIIIKKLHRNYNKYRQKDMKDSGLSMKYLRTNTDIRSEKMSDIFKGEKEIRNALVVYDNYRRLYRLNMD